MYVLKYLTLHFLVVNLFFASSLLYFKCPFLFAGSLFVLIFFSLSENDIVLR